MYAQNGNQTSTERGVILFYERVDEAMMTFSVALYRLTADKTVC